MVKRSYHETIDYLYEKLPMFSRIGVAAYKKDLTNTIALCNVLNNPHQKIKTIHIAGTNGKGSTSHMLAAIFQAAGYKTGLYTSPHLKDFGERIKINGEMIAQDFVIGFVEKMEDAITTIQPSFFEITVAMALDYFATENVDIAIIETGLGGRLDSTNVITPLLSIITNIGYDHQNLLGNTLPEIAREKAGIIKPNIPIIISETNPEIKDIFIEKADEANSPIYFADNELTLNNYEYNGTELLVNMTNTIQNTQDVYHLDLSGFYQTKNVKAVLLAVTLLQKTGWKLPLNTQKEALGKVKKLTGLHGRWECIQEQPTIILDVAHNVDGIKQLLLNMENANAKYAYDNVHIIFGMVKDKEAESLLSLLPKQAIYYFTQANIPRALDKEVLQEKAASFSLIGNLYNDVNMALDAAKKNALNNDLILVCGSVYLVGEVN